MKRMPRDFNFDRKADAFDGGCQGRASQRFYDLLYGEVKLHKGMRLLDVGCGTGTVLRTLADAGAIEGSGIDVSENMVRLARRKCPEMDIRISGCEATPFADRSFDALIACMSYHHFADKRAFARESARLLAPGGRLYIADGRLPEALRRTVNGGARLFGVAAEFQARAQIESLFAEYGFTPDGYAVRGIAQIVTLVRNNITGS